MFDWNGNGIVDDGDSAFEAFMIDRMNKETEKTDDYYPDDDGDDYYLDDEE